MSCYVVVVVVTWPAAILKEGQSGSVFSPCGGHNPLSNESARNLFRTSAKNGQHSVLSAGSVGTVVPGRLLASLPTLWQCGELLTLATT